MFRLALRHAFRFRVGAPFAACVSGASLLTRSPIFSADNAERSCTISRRRIIIDTDPGIDDILALLLACGSPGELQVEGLTIVCGNGKDIRALGANANLVLRLAGAQRVPVSLGKAPVVDDGTVGATVSIHGSAPVLVHGSDGMGDVSSKYGRNDADFNLFHNLTAPEFIYEMCSRHPGEISLVCIGPLGNIKNAIDLHPDLPNLVQSVLIMGGAFGERRGNRSPAAEANFFDDPEAAQAVLRAGFRQVVIAGLDVTHQTDMIVLRQACSDMKSHISSFVWDVCDHYIKVYTQHFGQTHAPAHDTVPVMYLLRPELFESMQTRVEVETMGEFTRGMSIADWRGQWGRTPNCEILMKILDKEAYTKLLVEAVARLPLRDAVVAN